MDDFGATFFDLASSSSSFSLCSVSANADSIESSSTSALSSFESNSLISNQVTDFDSIFSPETSYANIGLGDISNLHHQSLVEQKPDHFKDCFSSPHVLESSSENLVKAETTEMSPFDFIMQQSTSVTAKTEPDKIVSSKQEIRKPSTVTHSVMKLHGANNMVQLKMVNPGTLKSSQNLQCTNMIPVTVHSVSGVKHTLIHTAVPASGPCVRLFPASSPVVSSVSSLKEENQSRQTKRNLPSASQLQIVVCNVVASFRVRCHLNLRQIALESLDVIYRRETQKVVMRMRKPKCTAYIWSSGKIVCTGSSSEENARLAAKRFSRRLQKLGFNVKFADFKVVNVLAVSKMPFAIDINEFSRTHQGRHCSYEPELHPGVTYRESVSKATLKIFSTGSVTVTGRSVTRAKEAIRNVYPLLTDFYKYDKPNTTFDYEDALPSDTEDLS